MTRACSSIRFISNNYPAHKPPVDVDLNGDDRVEDDEYGNADFRRWRNRLEKIGPDICL